MELLAKIALIGGEIMKYLDLANRLAQILQRAPALDIDEIQAEIDAIRAEGEADSAEQRAKLARALDEVETDQ